MKKMGMIILILVILVFNFIIGANEKGLRVLPIGILLTLILIYLVIKKIKEPDKSIFFKSKIDYLVLLFMFTTTLPFIFKTYCSYSDTVEFILKYFFIYSVYILARNTITEKKQIQILITATLLCSLIPIILGLDSINGKYLSWVVEKLELLYEESSLFAATFGYSNAVAIYMSLCLFLALYKIKNTESRIVKSITIVYALFVIYIIWITLSRSTIALLFLTLMIYFLIGNREKIIKNWKKLAIGSGCFLIIVVPLFIYALNISEPFNINKQKHWERIQYEFIPNTKYTLKIDLRSSVLAEEVKDFAFEIQIIQANKYFKESTIARKVFGNMDGIISLEFTPEDEYSYINLKILNDYRGNINIRKCYLNGEEYIFHYKYLPQQVGKIFTEYKLRQKGFMERIYIYKDCLKIAKNNLLLGQGGNSWRVLSPTVQEYKASIKETHSYFFELLISYGVVGVLAFFTFIIVLFIKIIKQLKSNKEKRKEKLLIFIGLFFALIHSIVFDFSMSFMLIQLIIYIYIAVLIYDEQNTEKLPKIIDYILLAFMVFILSIYVRTNIAEYIVQDNYSKFTIAPYSKIYAYEKIKNEEDRYIVLNDIQRLVKKEPYYHQTEISQMYFEKIYNNIDEMPDKDLEKYLEFGVNQFKKVKFQTPLYLETVIIRTISIKNTLNKLKEYEKSLNNDNEKERKIIINNAIIGLEEVLDNEYEINIYNMEAIDRNDYSKGAMEMIKIQYLEILGKT